MARTPTRQWRSPDETGAVTAELAIGLVVIVMMLTIIGHTATLGVTAVRAETAAGQAARLAARGTAEPAISEHVSHVAGPGSSVTIDRDAPYVRATVTAPLRLTNRFNLALPQRHHVSATALDETIWDANNPERYPSR